jgi:acyl-ACP thioesterase
MITIHQSIGHYFVGLLKSLLPSIKYKSNHVRLSDQAEKLFLQRDVTYKIVNAIIEHQEELSKGDSITVQGESYQIELSSHIEK